MTVDVVSATLDPQLFADTFGAPSWNPWRCALRAAFALPPEPGDLDLYTSCTGRARWPEQATREAWILAGRRSGKSRVAALCATYLAAFREHAHLAPGERGVVAIVAADRAQARVVLGYVKALLDHPMLRALVERETTEGVDLANGASIEVRTASYRTSRGYTLLGVIADEIAFWRSDDSAQPDAEVLAALRPGLATAPGGLLLCISSPYSQRGEAFKAFRKHYGVDGAPALVWRAASRVMNPSLDAGVVDAAMAADPDSARAEWMAEFRSDLSTLLDVDAIHRCVIPERSELPPLRGVRYHAFADPSGGRSDSFTLAVGHKEGDLAVVSALREIVPPFNPNDAVRELVELLRSYNVSKVVGDSYAASWVSERFGHHGARFEASALPKSALYLNLLGTINGGRIALPDSQRLVAQLAGLERRTTRGGRDSIDHGPGAHDDLANAVAGVAHLVVGTHRGGAIGLRGQPWEWSAADFQLAEMQQRGEAPTLSRYFPAEWSEYVAWGRSTAEPGDRLRAAKAPGEPEVGRFR